MGRLWTQTVQPGGCPHCLPVTSGGASCSQLPGRPPAVGCRLSAGCLTRTVTLQRPESKTVLLCWDPSAPPVATAYFAMHQQLSTDAQRRRLRPWCDRPLLSVDQLAEGCCSMLSILGHE